MITVINASAAVTLLEQRPEKICVYKTRTESDQINKTWIGLRPFDKTQTGSEKNRIAISFPAKIVT